MMGEKWRTYFFVARFGFHMLSHEMAFFLDPLCNARRMSFSSVLIQNIFQLARCRPDQCLAHWLSVSGRRQQIRICRNDITEFRRMEIIEPETDEAGQSETSRR